MLANDGVTWPGCQAKNADLTGELGNCEELWVIWVLDQEREDAELQDLSTVASSPKTFTVVGSGIAAVAEALPGVCLDVGPFRPSYTHRDFSGYRGSHQ